MAPWAPARVWAGIGVVSGLGRDLVAAFSDGQGRRVGGLGGCCVPVSHPIRKMGCV